MRNADELLRVQAVLQFVQAQPQQVFAFRRAGVDRAEPSDWEIAGRYLSWTALPVLALALFIGGLR